MTRTTIADVAKAAGVSVSTVSRALRGLDRVNPETRERVEKEANPEYARSDRGKRQSRFRPPDASPPARHQFPVRVSLTRCSIEGSLRSVGSLALVERSP